MFNIQLTGVSAQSYSDSCSYNSTVKNLSLSVQTYGEFFCTSEYKTERSGMNQHLLLYTLAGKGKLEFHSKTFALIPGTLMLIDCAEPQVYGTDGDFWHFMFVHFTGSAAKELYTLVTQDENFCQRVEHTEEFLNVLSELVQPKGRSLPYDILHVSNLLERLFLLILRQQGENSVYRKNATPIENAIDYIGEHYGEKITLEQLAKCAFMSKYHFLRIFSRITGMTPMEYIHSYRLSRAQIFLKTTDYSVEQIAEKTGYENTAAFIRAFKKQTGTTPGKYKSQ